MKRPTRPDQLIAVKNVMFWVCSTPIGIGDIVMLPPGKTFDRSFFVDIVLDSLTKKLAQILNLNPEKGHFLHLDNARPHLADHKISAYHRLIQPLAQLITASAQNDQSRSTVKSEVRAEAILTIASEKIVAPTSNPFLS
jgi:hypothetical protein